MKTVEKILNFLGLIPGKNLGLSQRSVFFDENEDKSKEATRFILGTCNIIAWTNFSEGIFGKNWERDSRFIERMEKWKPYFIKKTVDNIEYGEIMHENKTFTHYFFKIEGDIRELIEKEGPIAAFPGFWDPIYYKDKKIVAAVVAHESIINFFSVLD